VPYTQNALLHEALAKVGAMHELFTVPGAGHGNFSTEERTKIYRKITEFLGKNGL
jgi:dipeptidyl aminopeptidase/acylaminoacyl peptidase